MTNFKQFYFLNTIENFDTASSTPNTSNSSNSSNNPNTSNSSSNVLSLNSNYLYINYDYNSARKHHSGNYNDNTYYPDYDDKMNNSKKWNNNWGLSTNLKKWIYIALIIIICLIALTIVIKIVSYFIRKPSTPVISQIPQQQLPQIPQIPKYEEEISTLKKEIYDLKNSLLKYKNNNLESESLSKILDTKITQEIKKTTGGFFKNLKKK